MYLNCKNNCKMAKKVKPEKPKDGEVQTLDDGENGPPKPPKGGGQWKIHLSKLEYYYSVDSGFFTTLLK